MQKMSDVAQGLAKFKAAFATFVTFGQQIIREANILQSCNTTEPILLHVMDVKLCDWAELLSHIKILEGVTFNDWLKSLCHIDEQKHLDTINKQGVPKDVHSMLDSLMQRLDKVGKTSSTFVPDLETPCPDCSGPGTNRDTTDSLRDGLATVKRFCREPQNSSDVHGEEGRETSVDYCSDTPLLTADRPSILVDPSATAFCRDQSVVEFMVQVLAPKFAFWRKYTPVSLTSQERVCFEQEIKAAYLCFLRSSCSSSLHNGSDHEIRTFSVLSVSKETAKTLKFFVSNWDSGPKDVAVEEYFAKRYFRLKYPDMPCLVIGNKKQIYMPIEACAMHKEQNDIHPKPSVNIECEYFFDYVETWRTSRPNFLTPKERLWFEQELRGTLTCLASKLEDANIASMFHQELNEQTFNTD